MARMKDEQLLRQKKSSRPWNHQFTPTNLVSSAKNTTTVKRLSWDEMQKRRAHGLCFNYDDKFTPRHRCRGSQLLLLEGYQPGKKSRRILA